MSVRVGDRLPDTILRALDGRDLANQLGSAYLVITVDSDGRPRPCMLSAGELLAVDVRTLRAYLWPGTQTAGNLAARRRMLLCYVAPHTVYYVYGSPHELPAGETGGPGRFEITVESVYSDLHKGMPVRNGIVFGLEDADSADVLAGWQLQLDQLRSH